MRKLLLLSSLLIAVTSLHAQTSAGGNNDSPVAVLSSRWFKDRQVIEKQEPATTGPAASMIPANKNFERNRRINDPAGVRDPNADSVDGRSAALEKSVQESRRQKPKPIDGFAYRVKIQNNTAKVAEVVFWEYQFQETANPTIVARRQFLCGVNIKPNKDTELKAFSLFGPSDVISAEALSQKSGNLFQERVIINRVEYADGSIWQRKDWNFAEVKASVVRATSTPWGAEMCRGL